MYCTDCGTINPEGVDVCLKCGKRFPSFGEPDSEFRITEMMVEGAEKQNGAAAPFADIGRRAAKPAPYWQNNSSYTFRFMVLGLVITAVVLVPAAYFISKQSGTQPRANSSGQMSPLDALKAAQELRNGTQGGAAVQGGPGSEGESGVSTGKPMPSLSNAFDLSRQANARKLQMAISVYYAENEKYPASLEELPPGSVGFELDPKIYSYEVIEKPYGYRLETTMKGKYPEDENMVTRGGESKFVLKWDVTY